jgi:hypothetical protein
MIGERRVQCMVACMGGGIAQTHLQQLHHHL